MVDLFKFDEAGLRELFAGAQMQAAVREAAEAGAERIRGMGITVGDVDGGPDEVPLPVGVETVPGAPIATALVTLTHPAGEAVQAKHGALTRGLTEAGLKVRGA